MECYKSENLIFSNSVPVAGLYRICILYNVCFEDFDYSDESEHLIPEQSGQ